MKNLSQEFTERTEKRRNLPPFPLLPPVKNLFRLLCLLAAILSSSPVAAQIQPAWVARYNNGIPAGNHQALKMALDTVGNIYVSGFSQESNSSLDYVTLKYAPMEIKSGRRVSPRPTSRKPNPPPLSLTRRTM